MRKQQILVNGAATVVGVARVGNRVLLVAVLIGFASTWAAPMFFETLLTRADRGVNVPSALAGIRLLLMIGVATAGATDRLLTPLASVIATARAGDPFTPANARRLRAIGWALLVLQLLDIACALLARLWPSLGSAAPNGDVSIGGWIAVVMVFVLARVFAAGTAMRDDLAGTV